MPVGPQGSLSGGASSGSGGGGTADVPYVTRSPDFTRVLKAEPLDTEEFRREETTLFDYNGLALDGAAESAATWKVVRFSKNVAGQITRIEYKTGDSWTNRAVGW